MNYEKEVIQIALLAGDDGTVRDATFEGCHIKGPAVLAPLGGSTDFEHNTFHSPTPEAMLWEVDPEERGLIVGVVGVENCRFLGCTFSNIGIVGPKELLDRFRT